MPQMMKIQIKGNQIIITDKIEIKQVDNLTAIQRMQKMSFKQILDQNKSVQEQKQSGYLFTRLKQQIINKTAASDSIATSMHQQLTLQTVLQECQLELQILKLEKANFIAMQVCQFGFQIQEVLHRVSQNIHVEIQHILTNKFSIMSQKKYPHNLQSTLHNTEGTHSIKKQSKKNSAAKNTLTPKIVEFTLGNRQASSGRSQEEDKNNSEEVSEFFVNSKGAASKSIRQKVMGPKKLK